MKERSIQELAAEYAQLKKEPLSWGGFFTPEAALHAEELYQEMLNRVGNLHTNDAIQKAFEIQRMVFGSEPSQFRWHVGLSIQNIKRELTNDWSSKDHR
jgi:hypothetical protein